MKSRTWMASATGTVAIAVALSAGSCSSSNSGNTTGDGGTREAGAPTPDATASITCTTDAQCAASVPVTTPANCATGKCNAVQGVCEYVAKDQDGDGHAAANCKSTTNVPVQAGDDCNDMDANLYPGHPESCSTGPDGGAPPVGFCSGQVSCLPNGTESPCTATLTCTNQACVSGACVPGCYINATLYSPGASNPANPCDSCQPGQSISAWTTAADGTSCGGAQICASGTCGPQCFIGGTVYAPGAFDPTDACKVCEPAMGTSAWSSAADGTSCGVGQYCSGGNCTSGCSIGGTFYLPGVTNPNDPCQSCQTSISTTAWSSVTNGTGCGNGQVCSNGQCGTQCDIGGTVYGTGTTNPSNKCQSCQPGVSTTAWTTVASGTSCGAGQVCNGAVCAPDCFINGSFYTSGQTNPSNNCQSCQPAATTYAWSNVLIGTGCGSGEVCNAGNCESGCFIGGTVYAPNAVNPANICQSCQPGTSTTTWSPAGNDGTTCASGEVCSSGSCVAACTKTVTSLLQEVSPYGAAIKINYSMVGGGGGGGGGSGLGSGGGGGSSAILAASVLVNYAAGGPGGAAPGPSGSDGATASGSFMLPAGASLEVIVGGGGGGAYEMGGGGGSGYFGGGGGCAFGYTMAPGGGGGTNAGGAACSGTNDMNATAGSSGAGGNGAPSSNEAAPQGGNQGSGGAGAPSGGGGGGFGAGGGTCGASGGNSGGNGENGETTCGELGTDALGANSWSSSTTLPAAAGAGGVGASSGPVAGGNAGLVILTYWSANTVCSL